MSTRDEREKASAMNKRHTAILNKLMALPENATCADCIDQGRPTWASWNMGTFLCIQCSGIHRSLGVHISKVRSITLDKWDPEWIQSMERGGNKKCNDEWEYHIPDGFQKLNSSSPALETFIRDKYERKLWKRTSPRPSNPEEICAKYHSMTASSGLSEMSYMSQSASSYQDGSYSNGGSRNRSGGMQGFGSNGASHKMSSSNEDVLASAMASLSSGWSTFAKSATEIATVAAEKTKEFGEQINDSVILPAREKLNDPDLLNSVQKKIKGVINGSKQRNRGTSGGDDFFSSYGMNESSGYSREEVNASVANKDSFFANLKAENNSRPDDLPPSQGGKYAGFGSSSVRNSGDGTGDYAKEDLDRSAANKESFFSGLMSKNASRPDNLPPSQGGKYAGFGSTSMPNSSSSSRSSTGSGSHGGSRSASRGLHAQEKQPAIDDGWGDSWGDDADTKTKSKSVSSKNKSKKSAKADNWDDDGWGKDW